MPSTPREIAHYKIVSAIGSGGMGEVYLAEDTKLDRQVALKILHKDVADDADRVRRFVQEAKAASALNHPNILTVYEIGDLESSKYMATELVRGRTLRQHLEGEPLTLREVLDTSTQVAAALNAAHDAGIVHRDIKPENLMLRDDGFVKVLDFGLAKLAENSAPHVSSEDATRAQVNTAPGMVMGTVTYMSPEQARGKTVDGRSDIWSLGVVMYEMLTGTTPFAGETSNDSIASILTQEPPPLDESTPAELQRIIRKTLQKKADDRYQTVKDLLIDLKNLKRDLEFSEELERSHIPAFSRSANVATGQPGENATAIHQAAVSTHTSAPQHQSSAEYLVGKAKNHKAAVAAVLLVVVAAIAGGYWFWTGRASAKQIESIAVMPFENVSGDANIDYLSDGMTESLINSLSQLPKLSVKARSSVFRYKGKDIDPKQIAAELGVQAVLNGRVQQRGDGITLSLDLVDAVTGNQIWGEQYTRKISDLVTLQNEIARDVSSKIKAKLTGTDTQNIAKNSTVVPEAYQLYLQGLFQWNKRTADGAKKATEYFKRAIEKDPRYALAYVGLANSYIVGEALNSDSENSNAEAKAYALKALEIDPTLGEAHAVLGNVAFYYEWDWPTAEREYHKAIELSPHYATAHHWYGEGLAALGRFDESFAEYNRALELDPMSLAISTDLGRAFYMARQYDRAIEHFKKLEDMDPNYVRTYFYLADVYERKGMFEASFDARRKGILLNGGDPKRIDDARARLLKAVSASGEKGYWETALQLTLAAAARKNEEADARDLAEIYSMLNQPDKAFENLEKIYKARGSDIMFLKVDSDWDNIRSDPRFTDLLQRAGLQP